jgi:hypothetical protein
MLSLSKHERWHDPGKCFDKLSTKQASIPATIVVPDPWNLA